MWHHAVRIPYTTMITTILLYAFSAIGALTSVAGAIATYRTSFKS